MIPIYNIKLVEQRVGIPSVTIRAWETRYGVIKPARTESGHRLYSEQDIEDILWLKDQTEDKGMSISQAAKLLIHRKERRDNIQFGVVVHQQTYDEISDRLYDALCNFQSEQANKVLDFGLSMFQHEELFTNVLTLVMQRVGEEWKMGKRTIAQEHFVTQFVMQRLSQFFRIFPIDPSLPKAISMCPSGEYQQVGLMLFSLFLRKKGLEVFYLGVDMPIDQVEEMISSHKVRLICISSNSPQSANQVFNSVRDLHQRIPKLKFVLIGNGFSECPADLECWKISEVLDDWRIWYRREVHV